VYGIYEDRGGAIWAGVGESLARFRNGQWTVWDSWHGIGRGLIFGTTEDDRGGFWVLCADALVRFSVEELNGTPDGHPGPLRVFELGAADGIHFVSTGVASPHIIKATDGRIWIVERNGVGVVDPGRLRLDRIPPPVAIEQVSVNGTVLTSWNSGPLSIRDGELRIGYNGISLLAPERVQFRYRLEPRGQWIDAGSRREITYASLEPGLYRFRVMARNIDGVWNETGAALDFRVEPRYYQTIWFKMLGGLAVALCMFGFYRLRVHRLTQRFELVAQERARMTREIHDSLLQGFAGVIFQLDAAWRQFDSAPEQSKQTLESALDRADQAMREARHVLSTMRQPALEDRSLPEAIQEIGKKATDGTAMSFSLKVKGAVEPLAYETQANLYLIGREAITNAVNHSGASRIGVQLTYTDRECRLRVEDNGSGFDTGAALEKAGHWGVRAMYERAQQIRAAFVLDSVPRRGTRIEVTVRRR
jgi:signal transduction histidine kinase